MGMMELLYQTYEYAYQAEDAELMENYRISQIIVSAPILLWITQDGEFADASYLSDKNRQKICIPCTEKSSGRSGKNPVPHPLFDKLFYLAGDGALAQIDNQKAHDTYMQNLQTWCESEWANSYIKTVFYYLSKNTLLQDLQKVGIISLSESKEREKRLNEIVRIGIRRDFDTDLELWRETCIFSDFEHYLSHSSQGEQGFCYITGEKGILSENHPKSIWNMNANAKLISTNEKANRGFVYSGRFTTANQAAQIGYETSQKIHNALKWLIQKQGIPVGDKMFVAWGISGIDCKSIIESTTALWDNDESEEDHIKQVADTQAEFTQRLKKIIFHKEQELKHNEKIAFLVLEAATPGRLSIAYYQEFSHIQYSQLIQTIENWHREHAWIYSRYLADKKIWKKEMKSPSVLEIALFAEGVEKNGRIEADKKVEGNTIVRLLPCVIDGKAIPADIGKKLWMKACHPLHYQETNWYKLLKITCSVLRTTFREVGTMEMNRESKDIPYNYGRWLAVAHEIERRALWNAKEKRETNAMRLFAKYAEQPCKYLMIIKKKIQIYEIRLGDKAYELQNDAKEIAAKLMENPIEEVRRAKHLDGRMVLGFEAQLESYKKHKEAKEKNDPKNDKKNHSEVGGNEHEQINEQD